MHIVIHTQYYPPEIGAPQARLSELAQGLSKRGWQVTVLTGMPSYPRGKVFEGYGGLLRSDDIDGVRIIRSFVYPTQSANLIPRLINYFSFVISSFFTGLLHIRNADIILTESPPLFLGITGYLLSKAKRTRWIFNVSDLWPESAVRLGAISEGWGLKISQWLERFCYQNADFVSGQSKSILENIKDRFPEISTYHLSNGVDTDIFSPEKFDKSTRQSFAEDDEIVAFYGGLHGLAQGLDQILRTAHELQLHSSMKVRFVFVGDGPEKGKLIKFADELNLNNVVFLDAVEKYMMPKLVASADICLVPLKTYLPGAVPSKMYEAMASGKPVVLIAEGEAADCINSAQAGVAITPGDIQGLTQAITDMASDAEVRKRFGNAGRQAALENFNRKKIVSDFAEFLERI